MVALRFMVIKICDELNPIMSPHKEKKGKYLCRVKQFLMAAAQHECRKRLVADSFVFEKYSSADAPVRGHQT